jgi:hypothetical protein
MAGRGSTSSTFNLLSELARLRNNPFGADVANENSLPARTGRERFVLSNRQKIRQAAR